MKQIADTVSAHIRRRCLINFYDLLDGVLFEFGQTGGLFKLACYYFHENQPLDLEYEYILAYFVNYIELFL